MSMWCCLQSMRLCHASDKLTEMERLAEQLRANGAEEYRTYVQLSSAFYRGVSCGLAICHVPWLGLCHQGVLSRLPQPVVAVTEFRALN